MKEQQTINMELRRKQKDHTLPFHDKLAQEK